jgi:colicin import membrane protein
MSTIELIEESTTEIAEYSATAAGLAELRGRLQDVAYDVTTTKGMAVAVKDRAEVRGLRVGLEKMRVSIKAPALERCRLIDAEAKKLTAELEALEQPIDDQIKVEEKRKAAEAETKRLAEVTRRERNSAALAAIRQRAFDVQGKAAGTISGAIVTLHTDEVAGFAIDADYKALEKIAIDETREKLREMHQAAIEREAEDAARKAEAEALAKERAELAKLRAEQEAREATARAELAAQQRAADEARAKADNEARALRDAEEARLRAERAEQQAKLDAERAELRKAQDEADRVAREARRRGSPEARAPEGTQREAAAVEWHRAAAARGGEEAAEHKARLEAQAAEMPSAWPTKQNSTASPARSSMPPTRRAAMPGPPSPTSANSCWPARSWRRSRSARARRSSWLAGPDLPLFSFNTPRKKHEDQRSNMEGVSGVLAGRSVVRRLGRDLRRRRAYGSRSGGLVGRSVHMWRRLRR